MTTYNVALSSEQIRTNRDEIQKCEASIKKYYDNHNYVLSCAIKGQEAVETRYRDNNSKYNNKEGAQYEHALGHYTIVVSVELSDSVELLQSLGECEE